MLPNRLLGKALGKTWTGKNNWWITKETNLFICSKDYIWNDHYVYNLQVNFLSFVFIQATTSQITAVDWNMLCKILHVSYFCTLHSAAKAAHVPVCHRTCSAHLLSLFLVKGNYTCLRLLQLNCHLWSFRWQPPHQQFRLSPPLIILCRICPIHKTKP